MTSNDRHASHNSPYRTGQHMPVSQSRHAPLTSVATSAADSQPDLPSSNEDTKRPSLSAAQPGDSQSPGRQPYSPGMRSISSPKRGSITETTEMQNFADGAPPPPPVSHSWKKIDHWAEKRYLELFDQLGQGCTQNDINELEHELDVSLPQDVRDSLAIHDGQERGGRPTGIIFGCMLLDCEEIVQEWKNWKTVNEQFLHVQKKPVPHYPIKALNGSNSASQPHQNQSRHWREELLDRQDSQPPQAVQKAYAHPAWISLARDWGGNNIAVDLAPGPAGKWGQVILFGRDYDCKYVVARSWAHFLGVVADDLASEKTFVDEETGELKLKEFKAENVEPAYMDILRWRADQRHGRRGPRRKPPPPPGLNTNVNGHNGRSSPYSSPGPDDRGRPIQRFSKGRNGSPKHQISSPLARVQEESAQTCASKMGPDSVRDFAAAISPAKPCKPEKLIDAPTPIEGKPTPFNKRKLVDVPTPVSEKGEKKPLPDNSISNTSEDDKENREESQEFTGLGVNGLGDDMKTVAL